MHAIARRLATAPLAFVLLAGCAVATKDGEDPGDEPAAGVSEKFASDAATLLAFEFDGELTSPQATNLTGQIRAQLFFTVGQINGERGVSRLDKLALTNVTSTAVGGGLFRIRYHVKLPVAWGSKTNLPKSYTLVLPRRLDAAAQSAFLTKYQPTCDDGEGADVTTSNYWYHYRPLAAGCVLADADVVRSNAVVTLHPNNTLAKYPEYQKVWEDGALDVVAVFGKYAEGATTDDDAGVATYDAFLARARAFLPGATSTPPSLAAAPGVSAPDVTFRGALPDGRPVTITAILVDNVSKVGPAFDKRYAELVPTADLIIYNGHAGLGANVRALASKGRFFPHKYQIFFMDGCDTFAYFDGALAATRAKLNPEDPSGTRYMEVVTNAMPAYFMNMPGASMALLGALAQPATPKTYNAIFRDVDASQVVVVDGEEDNVFSPSTVPAAKWSGLTANGVLGKSASTSWTTDVLPAGTYVFSTVADATHPGGDVDLRVRVGAAPSPAPSTVHKCQSYLYNSNERCEIKLTTPSRVYLSVTGDANASSSYFLRAYQL